MASRWIDVELVQDEPMDLGLDNTNGRIQFAFNILVTKQPSDAFDREIATVLTTAGFNASVIFISSKAQIPEGAGPYLTIRVSGGPRGIRTHNVLTGPTYRQSTAQILVTGATKPGAHAMAEAAMAALGAVKNQNVA